MFSISRAPILNFFCCTVLIAGCFFPASLWAAPPKAGLVISVTRNAMAESAGKTRPLALRSPIFVGDVVKTDATGSVQILFDDDSILALSEDGEATVNRFVYNGKGSASSKTESADASGAKGSSPASRASGTTGEAAGGGASAGASGGSGGTGGSSGTAASGGAGSASGGTGSTGASSGAAGGGSGTSGTVASGGTSGASGSMGASSGVAGGGSGTSGTVVSGGTGGGSGSTGASSGAAGGGSGTSGTVASSGTGGGSGGMGGSSGGMSGASGGMSGGTGSASGAAAGGSGISGVGDGLSVGFNEGSGTLLCNSGCEVVSMNGVAGVGGKDQYLAKMSGNLGRESTLLVVSASAMNKSSEISVLSVGRNMEVTVTGPGLAARTLSAGSSFRVENGLAAVSALSTQSLQNQMGKATAFSAMPAGQNQVKGSTAALSTAATAGPSAMNMGGASGKMLTSGTASASEAMLPMAKAVGTASSSFVGDRALGSVGNNVDATLTRLDTTSTVDFTGNKVLSYESLSTVKLTDTVTGNVTDIKTDLALKGSSSLGLDTIEKSLASGSIKSNVTTSDVIQGSGIDDALKGKIVSGGIKENPGKDAIIGKGLVRGK